MKIFLSPIETELNDLLMQDTLQEGATVVSTGEQLVFERASCLIIEAHATIGTPMLRVALSPRGSDSGRRDFPISRQFLRSRVLPSPLAS